jgi:hypothetical protein
MGGVAYECMGGNAHTLHEHVEYLTVADAVIETQKLVSQDAIQITVVFKSGDSTLMSEAHADEHRLNL